MSATAEKTQRKVLVVVQGGFLVCCILVAVLIRGLDTRN